MQISLRSEAQVKSCGTLRKARCSAEGAIRVQGSAGNGLSARRNGGVTGIGQQKTLPLPKRGSPAQALIEFVLGRRLDEGVAGKALFIQKDGFGLPFLP